MKSSKLPSLFAIAFFLFTVLIAYGQSETWDVPKKYKRMSNPYSDQAQDAFIGKAVYKKLCYSCHGNNGKGNGPKAPNLEIKLRSLTDAVVQSHSDGEFYFKIMFGKDHMPSFEKQIREEEDKWQLINYIRTFK